MGRTFVVSDIHGEHDMFIELLKKIEFKDTDTLYVLGDILDRGPHPIQTLLKLMEMPNAICIVGNHEWMFLGSIRFLRKEITHTTLDELDDMTYGNLVTWYQNGAQSTIAEFRKLNDEMQRAVMDFVADFLVYVELTIADQDYLLVHAGLGNFTPEKTPDDYTLYDLIWTRADYERQYYDDVYVVTGHTPTQMIPANPNPGYIFRAHHHIAIDCGASYPGGRLGAFCLETREEFYVERIESENEKY